MTKSDPNSIWLYDPTFALAIVFAILYSIPMAIQFLQTITLYKSYYFIVVLVGVCLEVGGYAARAASIKQLDDIVCPSWWIPIPLNFFLWLIDWFHAAATLCGFELLHSSRPALHRSRMLPAHIAPLPTRSPPKNHSYLPHSCCTADAHFRNMRHRLLPHTSIWFRDS